MAPKPVVAVLHRAVLNVGKIKDRLLDEEDIYKIVGEQVFKPDPQFDAARKAATKALVGLLAKLLEENPTQRFGQILQNYGFINVENVTINGGRGTEYEELVWTNEFYLEPVALLKRVQDRINDLKNPKG